jgi:hypothetical protein
VELEVEGASAGGDGRAANLTDAVLFGGYGEALVEVDFVVFGEATGSEWLVVRDWDKDDGDCNGRGEADDIRGDNCCGSMFSLLFLPLVQVSFLCSGVRI